jgi:hypothetical protein
MFDSDSPEMYMPVLPQSPEYRAGIIQTVCFVIAPVLIDSFCDSILQQLHGDFVINRWNSPKYQLPSEGFIVHIEQHMSSCNLLSGK